MAKATRVQLRDLVKAKRPEIIGNVNFPNAFLNELLNQAQRFVQLNLADLGIKEWEATDTLSLTNSTFFDKLVSIADLTSDCPNRLFDDERAVKSIQTTDGSSVVGRADYVEDDVFLEQINNTFLTPTAAEPAFTRHSQVLVIFPRTNTAIGYYYKQVTDMTTDSVATGIPEMYEEHIVKRVLVDVDDILGKLQNKQASLQQLSADIKQSFQAKEIAMASEKQPKTEVLQ
jgi:hypothetical protein